MTDRITDEMVEAAARAIFASNYQYEPLGGYDEMPPLGKKMARMNARAALSAALPLMDGWLPPETAPTDEGISFIVLRPGNDACKWLEVQVSRFEGQMYPDHRDFCVDFHARILDATAWRPCLPPAPKGDE